MKVCEYFNICGFVAKYKNSSHIDCRGFIASYCNGNKKHDCARLEYFKKHDAAPSDDMLPSGKILESNGHIEPYNNNIQQYY